MQNDISGATVWVTGAGSGIGAAMARGFAAAGCRVVLSGRTAASLEEVAGEIRAAGGDAVAIPVDVLDRDGIGKAVEAILARTGRLDILCNNAGLNVPRRRWSEIETDRAGWDAIIDVNIKGAINVIAASLPPMRAQQGGVIINTASWAGRFYSPVAGVAYGASKHALMALNASVNAEEGANGIRATALCPAEVATPLLARRPVYDPSLDATIIQPEDLADTALYVARMNPNVAVHEITIAPVRR
ncbi:SDR family NAD(P)-dependent oxidoreductase [Geminicoccaceae bacterium 1502E]|nr:SDR family NAD(P)-dependent oxidoreductase [Geminicoccaceae bacterium 1502E]